MIVKQIVYTDVVHHVLCIIAMQLVENSLYYLVRLSRTYKRISSDRLEFSVMYSMAQSLLQSILEQIKSI